MDPSSSSSSITQQSSGPSKAVSGDTCIWQAWNAMVGEDHLQRETFTNPLDLQCQELVMHEFYRREALEETQRKEFHSLASSAGLQISSGRPITSQPFTPARSSSMDALLLVEVGESSRRSAIEHSELTLFDMVLQDAHRERNAAELLALENEEEEDRLYDVEESEAESWRDLLSSASAHCQLVMVESKYLVSTYLVQMNEYERDVALRIGRDDTSRGSDGSSSERCGSGSTHGAPCPWGAAAFLRRHWELDELEVVERHMIREEERLAISLLFRLKKIDAARCHLSQQEQTKRRSIVLERLQQSSEMAIEFHHMRREIDEKSRMDRKGRLEQWKRERDEQALLQQKVSECGFWEMRGRWEIEGEEDSQRQLLLLDEGRDWSTAEAHTYSRIEREKAEEELAAFPLYSKAPVLPAVDVRRPSRYDRRRSTVVCSTARSMPSSRRIPPTGEEMIQELVTTIATQPTVADFDDSSQTSEVAQDTNLEWPDQPQQLTVVVQNRDGSPTKMMDMRRQWLWDAAMTDKNVQYLAASTVMQAAAELFALERAHLQSFARLRRDEHVGWMSIQGVVTNVACSILNRLERQEQEARLQLCANEHKAWHQILTQHQVVHSAWLKAELAEALGAEEAKARHEAEKEEWAFFYQIRLRFEDAEPERAVLRSIGEETEARTVLEAEEVTACNEVVSHYNAYIDRCSYQHSKELVKEESVARRKVEQECGRRYEDLAEKYIENWHIAHQRLCLRMCGVLQRWWRGELGRKVAHHVWNLNRAHNTAITLQCWWRCYLAKRRMALQRTRVARRLAAKEAFRRFEILERLEMESQEKLQKLLTRRWDQAVMALAAEELSGRQDIERSQRRNRGQLTREEHDERLQLDYPDPKASRRGKNHSSMKSSLAPALQPATLAASFQNTWPPPTASTKHPSSTGNGLDADAPQDLCTQALRVLAMAAENRRRFEEEMAAITDVQHRLPALPQTPIVHIKGPQSTSRADIRKLSPLLSQTDRQRTLEEIRSFALREPLANYEKDLAASAHYNSDYLSQKRSAGSPAGGLPALQPRYTSMHGLKQAWLARSNYTAVQD